MLNYFLAPLLIFLILSGWVLVQYLAREFSRRHPEFGLAREEGGDCGSGCHCGGGGAANCARRPENTGDNR